MSSRILRPLLGITLSIVAAVVVNLTIPSTGSLGMTHRLVLVLVTFALGFTGGWLVQHRWAIAGIPLIYIVSVWFARLLTCAQCAGPTAGIGIVRAGYYGILGLSPLIFGAVLAVVPIFGRVKHENRVK